MNCLLFQSSRRTASRATLWPRLQQQPACLDAGRRSITPLVMAIGAGRNSTRPLSFKAKLARLKNKSPSIRVIPVHWDGSQNQALPLLDGNDDEYNEDDVIDSTNFRTVLDALVEVLGEPKEPKRGSKFFEFYNKNKQRWERLKSAEQVQGERNERTTPFYVRSPGNLLYENAQVVARDDSSEDDSSDDDEDDEEDFPFTDDSGTSLHDIVSDLVVDLKEKGMIPAAALENGSLPVLKSTRNSSTVVPTREWILQQAHEHEDLQNVLLNHIGSLDHLVECLHFDFVWKKFPAQEDDETNPF